MCKVTGLLYGEDGEILKEKRITNQHIITATTDQEQIYSDSILLSYAVFDRMVEGIYDEDKRAKILNQIVKQDFDTRPENFYTSLEKACKSRHGAYLSRRSLSSLKKMKVFKVKGLNAGFALNTKQGIPAFSEVVAVHNFSKIHNIGIFLVATARILGGEYLNCCGADLSKALYASAGFYVYKELPNIKMRNGRIETLYFMKLKESPVPKV